MGLKERMYRLGGRMTKERWLMLLAAGAALMLLAMPLPGGGGKKEAAGGGEAEKSQAGEALTGAESRDGAGDASYEEELEARVREILSHVEGVGQVDVMIVLKSSEERVVHVDRNISESQVNEEDAQGGTRITKSRDTEESALSGGGSQPFVEKELRPELSGIVISAQGGGIPQVKAEISAAMEALFGLPAHKIKVLKRVD